MFRTGIISWAVRARRRSATRHVTILALLVRSYPSLLASLGRVLSYPTRYARGWDTDTNIALYIKDKTIKEICENPRDTE